MAKLRWIHKTREEQNAYQNGVNRTRAAFADRTAKIMKIAHGWREKARVGMGGARCDRCEFWTRGGVTTKWGYCRQTYEAAPGLGHIWAQSERAQCDLVSHENFACINFLRADDRGGAVK